MCLPFSEVGFRTVKIPIVDALLAVELAPEPRAQRTLLSVRAEATATVYGRGQVKIFWSSTTFIWTASRHNKLHICDSLHSGLSDYELSKCQKWSWLRSYAYTGCVNEIMTLLQAGLSKCPFSTKGVRRDILPYTFARRWLMRCNSSGTVKSAHRQGWEMSVANDLSPIVYRVRKFRCLELCKQKKMPW